MPTLTIGTAHAQYPAVVSAAIVEVKADWSGRWQFVPELRLVRATVGSSAHDLSACELRRRYGAAKLPWENDYSRKPPSPSGAGWWVRVSLSGPEGKGPIWLGRIAAQVRDAEGAQAHGPSGWETFVAYGPMHVLRRISVSRSWWWDADRGVQQLGWMPGMNHAHEGTLAKRGNRSKDRHGDSYLFGGTEEWTNYDFAEYLLARSANQADGGGPRWRLDGQADLLKGLAETHTFHGVRTLQQMLSALIRPELGIDWMVTAGDAGFGVSVFALSPTEYSFGGKTIPKNPATVRIQTGQTRDNIRTRLVETEEHGYKTVRVLGRPITVCATLWGGENGSLLAGWAGGLEQRFEAGTGNAADPAEVQDRARLQEIFRPVYQSFVCDPAWDFQGGDAAPFFDERGALVRGRAADRQARVQATLDWLPLEEGVDYAQDPPQRRNDDPRLTAPLLPPLVWIGYPRPHDSSPTPKLLAKPVAEAGIDVLVRPHSLGIFLNCAAPTQLGKNHFSGQTLAPPEYDWQHLVATIAFASDQRICLEQSLPGAGPSGGVLEIETDAECWYLAPRTVVGTREGKLRTSPDKPLVLRNDLDKLRLAMAGAISRYLASRCRAEVEAKGFKSWGSLVGQILVALEEGGTTHQMAAPITLVEWRVPEDGKGSPVTVVRAGFAHGGFA